MHSYVSQQADKHPISLVCNIWQQVFLSPDGKDCISTAYITSLLPYNFGGPDSGMHVSVSLSICLRLIKHMFKSFLEKKKDAFRKRDLEWCYSLFLTLNLVSKSCKLQFRKKVSYFQISLLHLVHFLSFFSFKGGKDFMILAIVCVTCFLLYSSLLLFWCFIYCCSHTGFECYWFPQILKTQKWV